MPKAKKVTSKNLGQVMDRLKKYVTADKQTATVFASTLNAWLDDLMLEDFFGTEGQCDPRGDQRD